MKKLLCAVVLMFGSQAYADMSRISELSCSANVSKPMIATSAALSPVKGNAFAIGVIWEYQSFVVYETEDERLAVQLGDSFLGSLGDIKQYQLSFTTDWPTKDKDFTYTYKHPSSEDYSYTLVCKLK